ncbi:MAG: putative LPS assembly protein LptD [Flavitalea sp.]
MSDERKNSLKYASPWILCIAFLIIAIKVGANRLSPDKFYNHLTTCTDTVPKDTLPKLKDTIPKNFVVDSLVFKDSSFKKTDTIDLNYSKDSLDAPITYTASDSIVFLIPQKQIVLFSEATVKKGDMDLAADSISIDQESKLITATYRKDTSGRVIGKPKMNQAGTTMEADVIKYNTQTQKGITQNTLTQQGEIYLQGQRMKKVSATEFFAYRSQFTTCNLDTPHFAFVAKKIKLINKKLAVTGPIHPEFEGVPIPIYLPFGIFPISQGRHSGFLPPTLSTGDQYGLGLQGLGYYKVFNDNFDATARTDFYTYGGWTLYLEPTYRVRYRYNGSLQFTMQHTRILSNDPKEDFIDTKTFNLSWRHVVDSKARPGTNFSANVNAGSTKFNQYVLNNPIRNYNNQLNSSIAYSKTTPDYNLTVSANHNQNNNSGLVTLNLPTIGFTANTIYPLQKKNFAGTPKWYEKLGIGLNTTLSNDISFYDSLFSFRKILDTLQWGAQNNIPIQMALPPIGPLQIAPGINYSNKWFSRYQTREFDTATKAYKIVSKNGFYQENDLSFSLSLSTALFGKFDKFSKSSSVQAIRHVIRPTVSINYKPDLAAKDYYTVSIKDTNNVVHNQRFSHYEGSIYSPFSEGTFGGISFGLDNNIEAKIRSKKDTGDAAIKKVKLIDGFGLNGGYNLLADSFKLSPITLYVRSTLFEKINLTAGATLNPYKTDKQGFNVDKFAWTGGKFSPGMITNASIAISTSFKSKAKDKNKDKQQQQEGNENGQLPMTMEEQQAQLDYIRQNPAEFADFNIPWSVNISYSLSYYRRFNTELTGFEPNINSTASINGDFNLTPRWKVLMNSYYNFKAAKIEMLTLSLSREMHCWQMSINVTPVGIYRSFNFTISPKSGILRDLKVNRSRNFREI